MEQNSWLVLRTTFLAGGIHWEWHEKNYELRSWFREVSIWIAGRVSSQPFWRLTRCRRDDYPLGSCLQLPNTSFSAVFVRRWTSLDREWNAIRAGERCWECREKGICWRLEEIEGQKVLQRNTFSLPLKSMCMDAYANSSTVMSIFFIPSVIFWTRSRAVLRASLEAKILKLPWFGSISLTLAWSCRK